MVKLWSELCMSPEHFPCDDQILLNHLYAYSLKIEWSTIPGTTGLYGKVRPGPDNNATFPLNVMLFGYFDVIRGGQPWNCDEPYYSKPWIMNPTNFHTGSFNKLGMFYVYRDCFMEDNEYLKPTIEKFDAQWIRDGKSTTDWSTRTGIRLNSHMEKGFRFLSEKIHVFDEAPTSDIKNLKFPAGFPYSD